MTCFFAVKTSPNMIGLTVKNIIIEKQLKKKFKVPGVLFCTIFEDTNVSMQIGWFTDVPPPPSKGRGQKDKQWLVLSHQKSLKIPKV
jgi:hypothetical protein